ncbi:MAG: AgmX/PglI C-terminal domain-containing protein, partial [Deltaproteobacteria bacterium]|nr:AgmX/PglI C-terminal domain-containing protein [Deltaproteobacteria bacterium]
GTPEEYEESEPEPPPLTAAERRLEWRGDEVTLPASRIDMAGGGEARALEDTEINATINSQSGGVRDCVIQGATGTDLRATITVKLVVGPTGKVSKSKLHAPRYLFDKGLLNCAQRSLRSMKFPATGAPTLVTLPISLG